MKSRRRFLGIAAGVLAAPVMAAIGLDRAPAAPVNVIEVECPDGTVLAAELNEDGTYRAYARWTPPADSWEYII